MKHRFTRFAVPFALALAIAPLGAQQEPAGQALPQEPRELVAYLVSIRGQGDKAVAVYRQALKHTDPSVRSAAVQMLSGESGEAAAPDIAPLTADPAGSVAVAAARAMLGMGGPQSLEPVRRALRSELPSVRAATAGYIGNYGDTRFVADLGALVSDPNASVRGTAVSALQAIGSPDGFRYLMAATADADVEVVVEAVRGLVTLSNPAALPRLVKLAESERSSVRQEAAYAIAKLGGAVAHGELLEKLLGDERVAVRRSVVLGLRDTPSTEGLPLLVKAAGSEEPDVRRLALLALKVNPSKGAEQAILELMDDADETARATAVRALAQRGAKKQAGEILELAGDPSTHVRFAVAEAIGTLEPKSGMTTLAKLVRDKEADVRSAAALAAGQIGGADALPILSAAIEDGEVAVRLTALDGLEQVRLDGALALLRKATGDEDTTVRIAAIRKLGARRDRGSLELLKKLAQEPAEAVRRAARTALRQIDDGAPADGRQP